MGTMTGWSPTTGDTVGIAINAEWIAAKTICSSPHTTNSIAAFQWAVNPDGNPSTITDMPDAISNSWYDPSTTNECSGIYKTTMDAIEAAGIAVVFSAGNNGPGASTITKPKNINTDEANVFCVANINGASYLSGNLNPIASSSSRGPSLCGGTGSLLFKPEVSAPGTSVRSAVPGGGYGLKSGTSMASPHVAGAITLLREAFPTLTGWEIKMALYNTAIDLGTAGEDNTYGKGLIDIFAAYNVLLPVELSAFTAVQKGNDVLLNWTTSTEINNSGFNVQRKDTEGNWTEAGFVSGKGSTTEISKYEFTDKGLNSGSYIYRLQQVDFDGSFEYSPEVEITVSAPTNFALMQNYPNPFNPATTIEFSLPEKSDVTLNIYSALGELVTTLATGDFDAGYHTINFDASKLTSGTYMYQITANYDGKIFTSTKKMSLVK
jgi:subtilisin family serine protease